MTVPRVLSLSSDGNLLIEPIEELKELRTNLRTIEKMTAHENISTRLEGIEGTTLEIKAEVDMGEASTFGMKVLASPNGEEETIITFNIEKNNITVDFSNSSLDTSIKHYQRTMNFMTSEPNPIATSQVAPFSLKKNEKLEIQIFIDKSIIEIFANGRQCITQRVYPTRSDSRGIEIFSSGDVSFINNLRVWDMSPTNQW
tara:strand:+ start:117 stop:716 length:600 start_codon:yes stop_codon:yes gene_type:complete